MRGTLSGCITVLAIPLLAACTNSRPGEVMVAVHTDMSITDDIDTLRVTVTTNGLVLHQVEYELGSGSLRLPGTLALVAGQDPNPVTVEVASMRSRAWRTLRRAVVSNIPLNDRITTLHLPVQWLCTDTDSVSDASRLATDPETTCPEDETCIAGSCVPDEINAALLPECR